jgi:hypothetical protein
MQIRLYSIPEIREIDLQFSDSLGSSDVIRGLSLQWLIRHSTLASDRCNETNALWQKHTFLTFFPILSVFKFKWIGWIERSSWSDLSSYEIFGKKNSPNGRVSFNDGVATTLYRRYTTAQTHIRCKLWNNQVYLRPESIAFFLCL